MKTVQAKKFVNVLERSVIARTGLVLYTILSSNGLDKYLITYQHGAVDSETHQDCKGFARYGHCYHVDFILEQEAQIAQAGGSIAEAMTDADSLMRKAIAIETANLDRFYRERGAALRKAREASAADLLRIDIEVQAHITIELAGRDATYGTCGHLSKNERDVCPACRSKWY